MQQAYSAIRVVSEAQTVRIVLSTHPDELMLKELSLACASLSSKGSEGIKAVVFDFARAERPAGEDATTLAPASVERAHHAMRAVAQPVLAIARGTLSPAASVLLAAADLVLVANDALLTITPRRDTAESAETTEPADTAETETLSGAQAARMEYATWAASVGDLNREMERILHMLREKSAAALRISKASLRLGQASQARQETPLETLQLVNALYLVEVMQTHDAHEGLHAFLEKRKPVWKNK